MSKFDGCRSQKMHDEEDCVGHFKTLMKQELFTTTAEFAEQLFKLADMPLYDDSSRLLTSGTACSMSLEHWSAVTNLLQEALLPSAVIVHRAQFEALLRSIWVLYAASEEQISKLCANLNLETEQDAKNLPQAADMMAALKVKAPPQAYDALTRFKDNSWKALNSYAHAGIHPIRRHAEGYPPPLIEGIAKNANGLAVLAAMQAVVLGGEQHLQQKILDLAAKYPDCMPAPL